MSAERAKIGLLDTSVFIAAENDRRLRAEVLPERTAISIVTVAELRAGVLAAASVEIRDRRLTTLERIAAATILKVDSNVAKVWAGMRAHLSASGRGVRVNDVWIAATAAAHAMPIVTQDRDFYALSGVGGLAVIEA